MSALRVLAVLLAALAACALLGAGPAAAHATLVGSTPADGAILADAPAMAVLRFSEPVRPVVIRIVGSDGRSSDLAPRAGGEQVEVRLPPLPGGTHVLSWRVVSADGHPVGGALTFSVGEAGSGSAVAGSEQGRSVALPLTIWAARLLLYAGLLFGCGTALAMAWLAPGLPPGARPGPQAGVLLALGAMGTLAGLGTTGLDLAGLSWPDLATARPWLEAASTSLGSSTALLLTGFGLSAVALVDTGTWLGRAMSLAGAVLGAVALATTGHAATAGPELITRPSVFVHALAALTWAGALPVLVAQAAAGSPALPSTLRRFSAVAIVTVGALAVAGGVLAVLQVRRADSLVDTAYGRILLTKLGCVAGLLALAAWNRYGLTAAALGGDARSVGRFRRSAGAEIVIMMAIAALVGLWRFTPPPRALSGNGTPAAHLHLHGELAMADVALTPSRPGENFADIVIQGPDFGALEAREVTLSVGKPDAGIEPVERRATPQPDGRWRVGPLSMPLTGTWSVRVDVLVSDFDKAILEGEVTLGP